MKICELLEGLPVTRTPQCPCGVQELEIERVVTSPKEAGAHTLYVACRTAVANGRYGMEAAFARGCRAFLCTHDAYPGKGAAVWITPEPERLLGEIAARAYGHPARRMTVLGITGSSGKTSVALQTVQALRKAGRRVSALTSDGTDILGVRAYPEAVVPDAAYIQECLAKMACAGSEIAVLEFSSYQLLHFAARGIPFMAVLLTNLSPRHVGHGEHEDLEAYYEAKLSLLQAPCAFCILPVSQRVASAARVIRVGEGGDYWWEDVRTEYEAFAMPQTRFRLCMSQGECEITLPVIGDFAVENAACAAALCRIVGLDGREIAAGLSHAPVAGRMECLVVERERQVYLDAAFLPQDLERVMRILRPLVQGRLCVLFGCVGGRAKHRRAPLVCAAEQWADHLYLSADDPDFEDPLRICREMQDAMREPLRATVVADRRAAILRAVREMRPGDLLLILAKPYPAGQLIAGEYRAFDERTVVAEAFAEF